jgi:4-hydroxybenzoate polyprenyltransferase
MLWTFVGVLLLLWLLGLLFHVGGGWIYTLVVMAAILVVYNVFINKPST